MSQAYQKIDKYLTSIFNKVLTIEGKTLRESTHVDVSIKENHTLAAIGSLDKPTPSEIARELMLTVGTVTISLNRLEKKGYIYRERSDSDRRVIFARLTEKGVDCYKMYQKFHKRMVADVLKGIKGAEAKILMRGLENLYQSLEAEK